MSNFDRLLIAIGCNDYDYLQPLRGAENDARRIYATLLDPSIGFYGQYGSRLLLSPTSEEVIHVLRSALSNRRINTLTIFFAGHGIVTHGSYYLCLKNSDPKMFSTTAMPLSLLFSILNEVEAAQCNIIFDACQAGGIVSDVGTLIKAELIGKAATPSISILAMSASDQFSGETSEGGIGTIQLLRCLTGDRVVQTQRPYLNLVEVGYAVSEALSNSGQTPIVYGLNLYGQPQFSRNPHGGDQVLSSLRQLTNIEIHSASGSILRTNADALWRLYFQNPEDLTPNNLRDALYPVISKLSEYDAATFVHGVALNFAVRSRASPNSFAVIEVLGACISLLLHLARENGPGDAVIKELAQELRREIEDESEALLFALTEDPLILAHNGLADLFYLPIRISKILGWVACGIFIDKQLGSFCECSDTVAEKLCKTLLCHYQGSLVAISDEQTPYILTYLQVALSCGWTVEGEKVLSHLFNDFHQSKGYVASPGMEGGRIPEFIRGRLRFDPPCGNELTAYPSEMLALLLIMARRYNIECMVDPYLVDIDHLYFNIFLPDDHKKYAEPSIEGGRNHSFEIGQGIWTVDDFNRRWELHCVPQLLSDVNLKTVSVKIGALCSSLIFPNRSPWFLLLPNLSNS